MARHAELAVRIDEAITYLQHAGEQARVLCEAIGDAGLLGMAQLGLANIYFNRGEVERGRALAAEVLALAEARGGSAVLLVNALDSVAFPEHYQGKFASSLAHGERAVALYDSASRSEVLLFGPHIDIAALGSTAWNLWCLGSPDRALARAEEMLTLARRLNHPFSLAFALFFETVVHWHRRDSARQQERAAETIALSETQGFPLFLGLGRVLHGTTRAAAGDVAGLAEVLGGLSVASQTGNRGAEPEILACLAETQHAAGQLAEARATVAMGLAISVQLGQPFWDADLHRLDGDLILAIGGAPEEAAARYQQALAIARAQEA